jgi:hypothetical protein
MAPENLPFAVALVLMLMIGAVEAVGLGVGAAGVDAGPDLDGDADLLGWLGVGRIPLLMLIVVLLALFGMIGIAGQQIAARGLARIMPQDETTAVSLEELVGLRATVVVGTARQGSPARASVRDRHGLTHYVMAEPTDAQSVGEGGTLLLVRREGDIFVGLPEGRDLFASAAAPGPPALMK